MIKYSNQRKGKLNKISAHFYMPRNKNLILWTGDHSLSSVAFIAVLKRFISKRSKCSHILSDSANFIESYGELRKLEVLINKLDGKLATFLIRANLSFIPSGAPITAQLGSRFQVGEMSPETSCRKLIIDVWKILDEYCANSNYFKF